MGIGDLTINFDIHDSDAQTDPRRAQTLLRCAQELVTNAVRHSQATNLWIGLERSPEGISLTVRDDGSGTGELIPGNGINGMRERLRELGGRLDISTGPKLGFRARAWLPEEGPE